MSLRVIALVAAHNEVDVIRQTTMDLIEQGVQVYLLDHGSTDGTADCVRDLVGRGLLAIEPVPRVDRFSLRQIMRRKEELATTLDADWFINHDADELRESPWPAASLSDALALVDRLGWNAVDFAVLNFVPTGEAFHAGDDLRTAFSHYEPGAPFDRVQIRCWKRQPSIDLETTAGHEVQFDGRRVFPIRFLLRHYPIRGQAHGERKVFVDRVPRFDQAERAGGWHVQYDGLPRDHVFTKPVHEVSRFDAEAVRVRLQIEHRGVEEREAGAQSMRDELNVARNDLDQGLARVATLEQQLEHESAERSSLVERLKVSDARGDAGEARVNVLSRELDAALTARAAETARLAQAQADLVEGHAAMDKMNRDLEAAYRQQKDTAGQLAAARAQLDDAHREIARHIATTGAQARGLDNARQEIAVLNARVAGLLASTSWRLTAPLRRVYGVIRGEKATDSTA